MTANDLDTGTYLAVITGGENRKLRFPGGLFSVSFGRLGSFQAVSSIFFPSHPRALSL